ncbi:MAG: hypothetical protein JJU27_03770 [Gammaproteobacteria bacterium]|nr:hypothetical protein [Gammaproteobacteria bacterium]
MSSTAPQRLAEEAARILFDEAIDDYGLAKRKARERLGLPSNMSLPKNTEVEQALMTLQRLFGGAAHDARIRQMRETAAEAMRVLEAFRPRLVGPVLAGTATDASAVNLHLFADPAEEVLMVLLGKRIPFESFERRLRTRAGAGYEEFPAARFVAGDVPVEITIFPTHGVRQAPLSPIDGRPMRRAGRAEVLALLNPDAPST